MNEVPTNLGASAAKTTTRAGELKPCPRHAPAHSVHHLFALPNRDGGSLQGLRITILDGDLGSGGAINRGPCGPRNGFTSEGIHDVLFP